MGAKAKTTNHQSVGALTDRIQLPRLNSFYMWSATAKSTHASGRGYLPCHSQ
jgi:hypothetical protein